MNSTIAYLGCEPYAPSIPSTKHPFLEELIQQFRLQDQQGIYQHWSNEELLQSLVFGLNDSDPSLTQLGILAFYQAICKEVEKETGKLLETFINYTHKGFGSVVICCGYLLVMTESFPQQNPIAFHSLDSLILKAEEVICYALRRIAKFF